MNTIIPINRKRFPIVLVISLLLTIFFTINLIQSKTENMYMDGLFNWIINSILLIISLLYTIISLSEYIKTLFDKKAMLQISQVGLDDNLSIFSCGKISWTEVSGAEITKVIKTDFLVIKLTDANKYLAGKNFIHRSVLKKYIKKWGSPLVISEKRVNYDLKELKQLILTHKAK